jgi:hypothetical protein
VISIISWTLYPWGKAAGTHLIDWVGPTINLSVATKRKSSNPCQELNPSRSVHNLVTILAELPWMSWLELIAVFLYVYWPKNGHEYKDKYLYVCVCVHARAYARAHTHQRLLIHWCCFSSWGSIMLTWGDDNEWWIDTFLEGGFYRLLKGCILVFTLQNWAKSQEISE